MAVQQQERHRLADDVAPADHDGASARNRNLRSVEKLNHAGRRARHERGAVLHQASDVDRVKPVHVFGGIQRVEDALLGVRAHGRRQRTLNENPVVHVAPVETLDECQQRFDARRGRQTLDVGAQSGLARRLQLAADVEMGRRVIADQHQGKAGRPPRVRRERGDASRQLLADCLCDGGAVQQPRRH